MISIKKMKYRFSLAELEELDDELNGRKDESTHTIIEPGLLDSAINLKLKFLLSAVNDTIAAYRLKTIDYRNKLIYKLGKMNPTINMPEIKMYENEDEKTFHPTYIKYRDQYNKYLTKEIDIESYPIDLELLANVERKERFPKLFKYIKQQIVEEEVIN